MGRKKNRAVRNGFSMDALEGRRLLSGAFAGGNDNAIAYDPTSGNLYAAWYDTSSGTLKCNYKDSSGNWVVKPTVETLGSLYPSLGFTTSDTPVISYYVTTAKDLKYARWNGTSWVKSTIDSTGDVGRSSSIQRIPGAADRFAVAYEYSSDGDFKYAELGTNGLWSTTTVDADPQAGGGFTSLAFDNNSNPSFSYYDSWIGTLKYASRNTSGTWTPTAISTRVSYYTNLWFNPVDGKGHLVYFDRSGNLLNHLTRTTSGTWTSPDAQLFLGGGNRVSAAFKTDGTIAYTARVEDPKALTKPWTTGVTLRTPRNTRVEEYECIENNQDLAHMPKP